MPVEHVGAGVYVAWDQVGKDDNPVFDIREYRTTIGDIPVRVIPQLIETLLVVLKDAEQASPIQSPTAQK
jgi:hypothetical protein